MWCKVSPLRRIRRNHHLIHWTSRQPLRFHDFSSLGVVVEGVEGAGDVFGGAVIGGHGSVVFTAGVGAEFE